MKTRKRGEVVQRGCKRVCKRGGSQGSLGCCEEELQEKGDRWIKKYTPDAIVIMNFFYKCRSNENLKRPDLVLFLIIWQFLLELQF